MRILIPLLGLLGLTLLSCQKESDFANTNNSGGGGSGGNNSSDLLVRMVQKVGSDSVVSVYGYNANKKLILLKKSGIDEQGDPVNSEYHFHRNAAGIITDYSLIDPDLIAFGIDSVTTIVHYNSSTSRYTSYVLNINIPGYVLLDSSVFVYDGSGRIIGEKFYESLSGLGNDYFLSGTLNYTYSAGGNVSRLDIHDLDQSGAEIFTATSIITYDSKTNPLQLGNEGLLLEHPEWASVNNITKAQASDSGGPADDQTVSVTYTYNSGNKPTTSVSTLVPDNITINTAFYYQ